MTEVYVGATEMDEVKTEYFEKFIQECNDEKIEQSIIECGEQQMRIKLEENMKSFNSANKLRKVKLTFFLTMNFKRSLISLNQSTYVSKFS